MHEAARRRGSDVRGSKAPDLKAQLPPAPHGQAQASGLFGTRRDLGFGQGAERMVDNHRGEIVHAERTALHLCLVQELGGDDNRCRPAQCFESDAVMRTARSARPSVADRGQHDVGIGSDGLDQCPVRVL